MGTFQLALTYSALDHQRHEHDDHLLEVRELHRAVQVQERLVRSSRWTAAALVKAASSGRDSEESAEQYLSLVLNR